MSTQTDDTDDETDEQIDGTLAVPPEKIVRMLELNDNMHPDDNNRRVIKVWNGSGGWNWQQVTAQAKSHRYPDSNPFFLKPVAFVDGSEEYYGQPPQRRHTREAVDVPDSAEKLTDEQEARVDEEHRVVVDDWRSHALAAVGGTIELQEKDMEFDPETGEHTTETETHRLEIVPTEADT